MVVDASTPSRFNEANQELKNLVSHPKLAKTPVLVMANKMDVSGAHGHTAVSNQLNLSEVKSHNVHIVPTSAQSGQG